jgi:predicted transcriptional regulator
MNEVKVHVEGLDAFAERSLEMARRLDRGERRVRPAQISFETMEALLKVLTPGRWTLLRRLRTDGPSSIRALSRALGRDYRGVHADVMALIEAGLVARGGDGKVSVPWSRITAEMALDTAA